MDMYYAWDIIDGLSEHWFGRRRKKKKGQTRKEVGKRSDHSAKAEES